MLALTILGNNSAVPAFGRNPTAQILQMQEDFFLIDCGEGTQLQMSKYKIRRSKISNIFISHMHGDHYFGLIGLLTSMSLLSRTQDLHLYAPPLLEEILALQLKAANSTLNYKVHFHPLTDEGMIVNTNKISVECFKVKHRIECWGFLFREIKKPRHIDADRVRSYEIPSTFFDQLQKGSDYINKKGTVIPNEELTTAAAAPRSYAYCADTIYDESLAEKIKHVDVMYHETTYLKDQHIRAAERFHSTTIQAADIAKRAEVKKLLIGHFSSKYDSLEEFLIQAKDIFEDTELALEGACFKI
ncbi:MAG: ribonuclease Z [Ferruginibacter sp.]